MVTDYRSGEGRHQLSKLASELVQLKVDFIVAQGLPEATGDGD